MTKEFIHLFFISFLFLSNYTILSSSNSSFKDSTTVYNPNSSYISIKTGRNNEYSYIGTNTKLSEFNIPSSSPLTFHTSSSPLYSDLSKHIKKSGSDFFYYSTSTFFNNLHNQLISRPFYSSFMYSLNSFSSYITSSLAKSHDEPKYVLYHSPSENDSNNNQNNIYYFYTTSNSNNFQYNSNKINNSFLVILAEMTTSIHFFLIFFLFFILTIFFSMFIIHLNDSRSYDLKNNLFNGPKYYIHFNIIFSIVTLSLQYFFNIVFFKNNNERKEPNLFDLINKVTSTCSSNTSFISPSFIMIYFKAWKNRNFSYTYTSDLLQYYSKRTKYNDGSSSYSVHSLASLVSSTPNKNSSKSFFPSPDNSPQSSPRMNTTPSQPPTPELITYKPMSTSHLNTPTQPSFQSSSEVESQIQHQNNLDPYVSNFNYNKLVGWSDPFGNNYLLVDHPDLVQIILNNPTKFIKEPISSSELNSFSLRNILYKFGFLSGCEWVRIKSFFSLSMINGSNNNNKISMRLNLQKLNTDSSLVYSKISPSIHCNSDSDTNSELNFCKNDNTDSCNNPSTNNISHTNSYGLPTINTQTSAVPSSSTFSKPLSSSKPKEAPSYAFNLNEIFIPLFRSSNLKKMIKSLNLHARRLLRHYHYLINSKDLVNKESQSNNPSGFYRLSRNNSNNSISSLNSGHNSTSSCSSNVIKISFDEDIENLLIGLIFDSFLGYDFLIHENSSSYSLSFLIILEEFNTLSSDNITSFFNSFNFLYKSKVSQAKKLLMGLIESIYKQIEENLLERQNNQASDIPSSLLSGGISSKASNSSILTEKNFNFDSVSSFLDSSEPNNSRNSYNSSTNSNLPPHHPPHHSTSSSKVFEDSILKSLVESILLSKNIHSSSPKFSMEYITESILYLMILSFQHTLSTISWMFYELSLNSDILYKCQLEIKKIMDERFVDEPDALKSIVPVKRNQSTSQENYTFSHNIFDSHPIQKTSNHSVWYEDIPKYQLLIRVMKETHRLHPPYPLISRTALVDFQFGQYIIKKNTTILVSILSLHRNPSYWYLGDQFYPQRFSNQNVNETIKHSHQYLPFGYSNLTSNLTPGTNKYSITNSSISLIQRFTQMVSIIVPAILLSKFDFKMDITSFKNIKVEDFGILRPKNLVFQVSLKK